jgi:NAD+ synthase (glutamine-hydrolysing)
MQIILHQTHHEIGDFEGVFQYLSNNFQNRENKGLHLFPELFLTGYPLQDLSLKKSFIDDYKTLLDDLSLWSEKSLKSKNPNDPFMILLGGLDYELNELGLPQKIQNVIYKIVPGKKLEKVAIKQLLPNYDLYEEKKYFSPGLQTSIIDFDGKNIALLICEDMWFSHLHDHDPIKELKQKNEFLDLIVNFSASPYYLNKDERRIARAKEISQYLNAPFVYVNRVGAEDEILFDGQSFIVNGDMLIKKLAAFKAEIAEVTLPEYRDSGSQLKFTEETSSWDEIYRHRINLKNNQLIPLSETELAQILDALMFGIYDYAHKSNISKFSIALSGGMDSALVITVLKLVKDKYKEIRNRPIEVEAVFMPGFFSSSLSYDLSYDLCQNLGFKLTSLPIKFIHSTIRNNYREHFHTDLQGIADENIQSRLRGALIYARSNEFGSMVLNTSNKSELSVGYSTMYGDSVGALSVLGDLYKTEVFEVAKYINKKFHNIIPNDIITRPPSAELRENQEDAQSLPPYEILDPILDGLLSMSFSPLDLVGMGFNQDYVAKVFNLYSKSEYKRRQFCPIIKIKPKSFGFGYRVPICKKPF